MPTVLLSNTDTNEFYIIRMTTNVQEETEGKSSFGYPNQNAVLLTMLSYGNPALYKIFRPSLNGITYCESAELQGITLNLVG